jgi:hypothetical protein
MRYEPPTTERAPPRVTMTGAAVRQPVSALRPGDHDKAASRRTAELDIWEDEGGATVDGVLGFSGRDVEHNFDELPADGAVCRTTPLTRD